MIEPGLNGGRAAVLGAGRQGTAAAYDFASWGGATEVVVVDVRRDALDRAVARLSALAPECTFTARQVDGADEADLAGALDGCRAAVSALPYRFGPAAARAAVHARCHLADLGGNTDISAAILELHAEAKERGVVLVPDTGLAPGLANTLAAAGIVEMEQPETVQIWCGGLPQHPMPPLGYRLVFSVEGLLNEYSGDAIYLRDGELVRVPALSELQEIELPGMGPLEAFPTSGGTSTAPQTFRGKLRTFEYRTLRYPGHRDRFTALAELGLLSETPVETAPDRSIRPRDLLIRLLTPLIDHPGDPDLVVMRVLVEGRHKGQPARACFDLLDHEDRETGFTAMERCTAFPAAVVAEMAAAGEIVPGARPLETAAAPDLFLERLARRPLALHRS